MYGVESYGIIIVVLHIAVR